MYTMYARLDEPSCFFREFCQVGDYVFIKLSFLCFGCKTPPRVCDVVFKFTLLICTKLRRDLGIYAKHDVPKTERAFIIDSVIHQKQLSVQAVGRFFHEVVAPSYTPLAPTLTKKKSVNGSVYSSLFDTVLLSLCLTDNSFETVWIREIE